MSPEIDHFISSMTGLWSGQKKRPKKEKISRGYALHLQPDPLTRLYILGTVFRVKKRNYAPLNLGGASPIIGY